MVLGYIIIRSPYAPDSIYLRGTIGFWVLGSSFRDPTGMMYGLYKDYVGGIQGL